LFRGIALLTIDNKGRMSVPAKFRQRLLDYCDGQVVVTIDHDRCLLLYPLPSWEEVEQKLVQLSSTNKRARALKRLLLGHAEECEMDASGRILLSAPLREFAGLDKRVVLVGQGNKLEIWDEQSWNSIRDEWLDSGEDDDLPADLESLSF